MRLGTTATPDRIAQARAALGLDRPLLTRYADWATGLLHGSLGTSATGRPVAAMLSDRIGNSVLLAALAMLVLVPGSLVLGLFAARRRGSAPDRVLSAGALFVVSVPEFVLAGVLVLVFSLGLGWLPAVSLVPAGTAALDSPELLLLPTVSLALAGTAYALRVIRAAAVTALRAGHVEFLRLSGASTMTVLRTAVLPAILPVAVQTWLLTGVGLVGGAVLVERVYGYPGIGELLVTAVQTGDLPVAQALAMILGAAMLIALGLADLSVRLLTPRLRTGGVW
jgi:peptide/nickel transport system permease protein